MHTQAQCENFVCYTPMMREGVNVTVGTGAETLSFAAS